MNLDKEYALWIAELAQRYRSNQIKAAIKVNNEMLRFYWSVVEDIVRRRFENRYGTHFYANLSKDLKRELGLRQGLSATTLKYTKYFYQLYSQLFDNRQQDVDDLPVSIRQQDADVFDLIFRLPWTHHMYIIDKVKGDARKGLFFAKKSFENNWGRAVLLNFLAAAGEGELAVGVGHINCHCIPKQDIWSPAHWRTHKSCPRWPSLF